MRNLAISILVLSAAALSEMSCSNSGYTSPSPTTTVPPSSSADVLITIQGMNGAMSFSPASATVRVGQTVAWKNADSITHNIQQNGGGFGTGNIAGGGTSNPVQITQAGSLGYHCAIHPTMTGTMTVTQ